MPTDTTETRIRGIIDARIRAVKDGDANAITADVADDVTIFDVVTPLRSRGRVGAQERAVQWLDSYDGQVNWDTSEVHIYAGDDVAFAHFLSRVTGTLKTGAPVDMWFRTTLGFRHIDEKWQIVHDHSSDPFDPETGQAATSLKP